MWSTYQTRFARDSLPEDFLAQRGAPLVLWPTELRMLPLRTSLCPDAIHSVNYRGKDWTPAADVAQPRLVTGGVVEEFVDEF